MANDYKNVLLRVKQGEEINNLFVQTTAHNVIVDKATGETLKQRLKKIAKQLGDNGLTVTEQVQEIRSQIEELIGNSPENLNSIHEIADFLQTHQEQYEAIKVVAEGMEAAIAAKIGELGEYSTAVEYVDAAIEASKAAEAARCAAEIAAEKAAREAADTELATQIGVNTAAIEAEATRAEAKEAELADKIDKHFVVFTEETFDADAFNDIACIILADDPTEAGTEGELIAAAASENKNIVLTSDITVTQDIDLSGFIVDADGYEIVGATQDVVITL